jgi:hypothetical protein
VRAKLKSVLIEAAAQENEGRLVIVVDGLDQLGAGGRGRVPSCYPADAKTLRRVSSQGSGLLDWIPEIAESGTRVRFIFSCTTEYMRDSLKPTLTAEDLVEIELGHLSKEAAEAAVKDKLSAAQKELEPDQWKSLTEKTDFKLPLFMNLVCSELELFGLFEKLSLYISELPNTIEALYQHVLGRLENDLPEQLVKSAVLLLWCSETGLRERELIDILKYEVGLQNQASQGANIDASKVLPGTHRGELLRVPSFETPVALWWPPLFRNLQSLLVPKDQVEADGLHNFAHRQARNAVYRC